MSPKRLLDLSASAVFLACALPVFGIVALLVKLDSPGPVFYRAKRLGKGGREFQMLKFRTMVVGADRQGPPITYLRDPRITRVGRFLRDTKLDEIPQLWNVLKGDMSLVGPRAEDPRYRSAYEGRFRPLLDVPPGMTGLSWVRLRRLHEEKVDPGPNWEKHYTEVSLPSKLEADLEYVQTRSFFGDLRIIAETLVGFLADRTK